MGLREEVAAIFEGLDALKSFGCSKSDLLDLRRHVDAIAGSAPSTHKDIDAEMQSAKRGGVRFNTAMRFWKRRVDIAFETDKPSARERISCGSARSDSTNSTIGDK